MNSITIDKVKIGANYPPYIVAEMSANHNGKIENAFKLIKMAKNCGADAVKIQTYRPDTITIKSNKEDFKIKDGLWKEKTLYDLYEWAHTPWEWHKSIFEYAKKVDMTIFSSPFDKSAVDLLEDLNCPAYKIASFELVDLPLIEYVAATKKPVIMSTGMASFDEIEEAVSVCRDSGCKEIALLHCVSAYPANPSEYNLRTIADLISKLDVVVGLSDHTLDNTTAISSISQGASIIEKHFTLDRNGGGPDDSFSLEKDGLQDLCLSTKTAWKSLGEVSYKRTKGEKENLVFRRSLYFVKDLMKGEIIKEEHIKSIRPGFGLKPKFINQILGLKVSQNISRGTAVKEDHLKNFKKI